MGGTPTIYSSRVGRKCAPWDALDQVGVCVSVTKWGNDRIRWMRLRFPDGSEKSYAPSQLRAPEES